jgi:hypothetical protein
MSFSGSTVDGISDSGDARIEFPGDVHDGFG